MVEVLFFLEAIAGDLVLTVTVHFAAAAAALIGVLAAAATACAQILVPEVDIEEGPVAVGHGFTTLFKCSLELLSVAAIWVWACAIFFLFAI